MDYYPYQQLARERSAALRAEAETATLARSVRRVRGARLTRRALRSRAGWLLVEAGLRLLIDAGRPVDDAIAGPPVSPTPGTRDCG